jgi:hypothetical protein
VKNAPSPAISCAVNFTNVPSDSISVHSSSMTPPLGLKDLQCFDACSDRPEFVLDRSLKVCRFLAQLLNLHQQVLGRTRIGRRVLRRT